MSLKSNLLKWLQSASQRKHRASEGEPQEPEKGPEESQPKQEAPPSPEQVESHQEENQP